MSVRTRQLILRANAAYVALFGTAGFGFDLAGAFYGLGPQGRVLAQAPHAAIGFVEAHGLAVILAALLWRAAPERAWHIVGGAMVALLGISNLTFWQLFVQADALVMGYLTTSLHLTFAALHASAAATAGPPQRHVATAIAR
jgi:hypothetical protein